MSTCIAATGIALIFLGSAVLFFYHPLREEVEDGVHVFGPFITQSVDAEPSDQWEQKAGRALERQKLMGRIGFGLIAVGSLLQFVSVVFLQ